MSEKKTPAIRFEGFMDEWEQHEFGDIAKFINGRAYAQNELLPTGKYKVLRVGNFYTNESWYYSNLELVDKYYAKYGDLLYTWSATFGPHIWHGEKVIYHYHIWKVDVSNRLDKYFAMQLLEQDKHDILSGYNGSTMAHITKYGMEKKRVTIPPNIEEQKQLGIFLGKLDNLIALHQHKLTKLQLLKKSMLTKMFPKDGARVPEIRFQGFHGDWEQHQFRDVGSVAMCKRVFKDETSDKGDIPFFKIGTFGGNPDAYISRELFDEYKSKYPYPEIGDILLSASGTIGRQVEYKGEDAYYQDSNIIWLKHGKILSNKFLKVVYQVIKWNGVEGSTIQRLYNDNILKTRFFLPSLEEQEAIGDYFYNLDNLISLQKDRFAKLQQIKQAMLSKLFV